MRKIYQERGTEESFNNEDEDNLDEEESVQLVSSWSDTDGGTSETAKNIVPKTEPPMRKDQKLDEVDLNILKALDIKKPERKKR